MSRIFSDSRFFFMKFLLFFLFSLRIFSAITSFDVVATSPSLPVAQPLVLGSSLELKTLALADQGQYTIQIYKDSSLNEILVQDADIVHEGGNLIRYFKVPLEEGENAFFLKIFETSAAGGVFQTSTQGLSIIRDLDYEVSSLRLNHLEDASGNILLYTNNLKFNAYYTISGNASSYQIEVYRNQQLIKTVTRNQTGNSSISDLSLETDSLNLIQLKARVLDSNGVSLGIQKESNVLRVVHDKISPKILPGGLSATFQAVPPAAGAPWGPTDLANFSLMVETDTPYANLRIFNRRTGTEIVRTAQVDGRLIVAGIELPKDPTLGVAGITLTTYDVQISDYAGNMDVGTISVERLALEPCFSELLMKPGDGFVIPPGGAINIEGMVCEENKPHRVMFSVATLYSSNQFFKEEQLEGLLGATPFSKDISIPMDTASPGDNVVMSVQAVVYTSSPGDPKVEVASGFHDLGVVILDRKPPAAPVILTERVLFATNSASFTVDGNMERGGSLEILAPAPLIVRPSRKLSARGDEFRAVLDLGYAAQSEYRVDFLLRDKAGNLGPGSETNVILKFDRIQPKVQSLRVNSAPVQEGKPLWVSQGKTLSVRVHVDEKMIRAPSVFITQQGGVAIRAGLVNTIVEGFEWEYQYVVREGIDGSLDGYAEIYVTAGSDTAGNPLLSYREPHAFAVDTLPPVLMRNKVKPADGSVVNRAPAPLRLVFDENPKSKLPSSGPDVSAIQVSCTGPIESFPTPIVKGRLAVFDPRTVDFYPDPTMMNQDGTYLFQISMQDKAGNTFTETVVLQLDTELLSKELITEIFPSPFSRFNFLSFPKISQKAYFEVKVDSTLLSEMDLNSTTAYLINPLRKPQNFRVSAPSVIGTTLVRFTVLDEIVSGGKDDGVFQAGVFLRDRAGNTSSEKVWYWYVDTLSPSVMDGIQWPPPWGYTSQDMRSPLHGSVVGPYMKSISSVIYDQRASNGFLGTGIDTSVSSQNPQTVSTIHLYLQNPFGSTPAGLITSSRIKFRGDLEGSAPIYGGPPVTRMIYELNVDPLTLEPRGLPADGSFDGVYKMEVQGYDLGHNSTPLTTSWFLYDTVAPFLSVEMNNEVWLTSGVLDLFGSAMDPTTAPVFCPGFGSTDGLGVSSVEVRLDSVNERGSVTWPAIMDWMPASLDREPSHYQKNYKFNWKFSNRIHAFTGRGKISVRAWDKAGNFTVVSRELNLLKDQINLPVLLSPSNDKFSRGGLETFSWQPVEQATGYVLLIQDPLKNEYRYSFTKNTLNAQVNLHTFSEGVLLWRVIAMDAAGKESASDNARRLILDRTPPSVNTITFSNPVINTDTSGRVLSHSFRVDIRFSESLDFTKNPVVFWQPSSKNWVDSSGVSFLQTYPAVFFQKIDAKENQWTGIATFSMPADQDFNGTSYLFVSDYQDSAKNPGVSHRHDFEAQFGPWFEFKAFSNPIQEKELIFVIKGLDRKGGVVESVTDLPFLRVRQQKDPTSLSEGDVISIVALERLGSSYFHGSWQLNPALSGRLQMEITGTDSKGNRTTRLIPFQITRISYSLSKTNSEVVAIFPGYTHPSTLEDGIRVFNSIPGVPLETASEFVIHKDDYSLESFQNFAVMETNDEQRRFWVPQKKDPEKLSFSTSRPGSLVLIHDISAPQFSSDLSNKELFTDFRLHIEDSGVGIDWNETSVKVAGRQVSKWNRDGDELVLSLQTLPKNQEMMLEVEAKDYLGNQSRYSTNIVVVGPVRILQAIVTPNPVQNHAFVQIRMNRSADLSLDLYDVTGAKITSISVSGNKNMSVDLSSSLASLANGVYFLKVQALDSGGNKDKKTIKIAKIR